jgi:hypothetical protein
MLRPKLLGQGLCEQLKIRKIRLVSGCEIKQSIEVMNTLKLPSAGDEKAFQIALHGFLQKLNREKQAPRAANRASALSSLLFAEQKPV